MSAVRPVRSIVAWRPRPRRVLAVACALAVLISSAEARQTPAEATLTPEAALREAQRLFDNAEYERALPFLDRVVASLEPLTGDAAARSRLASTFELRARTHFGVGNREQARADFEALLRLAPAYPLPAISPAIERLFKDIKATMVGELVLDVEPRDAEIQVDGAPVSSDTTSLTVLAGLHTVGVTRSNYRSRSDQVVVNAGAATRHEVRLERLFANVRVTTAPPDVDVSVNGVLRGRTVKGTPSPDAVEWARGQAMAPDQLSAAIELDGLSPGVSYTLLFKRDCFAPLEIVIQPPKAIDLRLDPVVLDPTVGSVSVTSDTEGTVVYLDGEPRGNAPLELGDVCEGRHLLQLRTPYGRDVRRLDVQRGGRIQIEGEIRPSFAIAVPGEGPRMGEVAQTIESALSGLSVLTVFAPDEAALRQLSKADPLALAALAVDQNGQPLGAEANRLTRAARSAASQRACRALDDVQGTLAVTELENGTRAAMAWWACGSATPDTFVVKLDDPAEIRGLMAAVESTLAPVRPSLGVLGIDVEGLTGVVVADIEGDRSAGLADVEVGDVIVEIDRQPVPDQATLERLLLASQQSSATVTLKARAGQARVVDLPILRRPRVIGLTDRTFTANPSVGRLRALAAATRDPAEVAAVRLSLAVALMKVEAWSEALPELQKLRLPDGPGVSQGTVHYLTGLCHEALGQRSQAQQAWQAAASSDATLTEDGPPVAPLAQARLRGGA